MPNSRPIAWKCDCACGKTDIIILGENLKRGFTKSCGCDNYKRPENLIGMKFGKLLPLYYFHKNNKVYWRCKCECGNFTDVLAHSLKSNRTMSCGCINYSIGEKNISSILEQNNISYIHYNIPFNKIIKFFKYIVIIIFNIVLNNTILIVFLPLVK